MIFRLKQQVVVCVMMVVLMGGFFLLRYRPLCQKVRAARGEIASKRLIVSKALTQRDQIPALKEQLLKIQNATSNYEIKLPAERELGGFLQEVATLMNEHNLKDQRVEPGREVETENLYCIPVSIYCRGGLERLFAFYKSLSSMSRLVRIQEVRLLNDRDFSGEVAMETKAVIYYRAESVQG